ncbi:hypothetical protein Naga_100446g4 [Nannochloropsis gaditana]|uniref:Thioredoxin-like fold domain-containing protein n=1 Tax=Nannochloropsis gaditana TaxID=72520 RepID=W7TMP2_9STRA|nr:hypothetical protein Naga_100446g4 [Nannochloropsis gaditana]
MECADGVCKFVPRSQRGVQIGGNEENVEPALPLVSVGDKPPMPLIFETLEEGGRSFSLQRLCAAGEDGGRVVVLDLWSNACVRCPEALDKLNQMSSACQEDVKKHRVTFAAVNIDDKVKARALVAERQWDCLAHFYIDAGTKDTLKARFGLQSVPFVMVFDQVGGGAGGGGRSRGRETADMWSRTLRDRRIGIRGQERFLNPEFKSSWNVDKLSDLPQPARRSHDGGLQRLPTHEAGVAVLPPSLPPSLPLLSGRYSQADGQPQEDRLGGTAGVVDRGATGQGGGGRGGARQGRSGLLLG